MLTKNYGVMGAICACLCMLLPATALAGPSKKSSALCLLQTLRTQQDAGPPMAASSLLRRDHVSLTIRFARELSAREIENIERSGLRFSRMGGQVVHFRAVYAASAPWSLIDHLADDDLVERIEPAWIPGARRPLDVSVPEIRASQLWDLTDDAGRPITGEGVIIADFDSGVDVFHPLFWKADGESFAWLDVNGNGLFDAGVDAVDLNGNGAANDGESLGYVDASMLEYNEQTAYFDDVGQGGFQPDVDWLYADANGNGRRDYGAAGGFGEGDATFGEQVFVAVDANSNRVLDPAEQLMALSASKIIATLNTDGIERRRGQDLMATEEDASGHGTAVAGILCGGERGIHKYAGVAPDAELLVQNIYWGDDSTHWAEGMAWAEQQGARVMLHEIGSWVFEFLDGSSNIEAAIDAEAEKGIVQVVPAGNLGGAGRHARVEVAGGQSAAVQFQIPLIQPFIRYAYMSVLWKGPVDSLQCAVRTPFGFVAPLPANGAQVMVGLGAMAWSYAEQSSRGTSKIDIALFSSFFGLLPLTTGTWALQIENTGAPALAAECYIADEVTTWAGGALFLDNVTDNGTIDFPATADSAIAVASYSTRGIDFEAIGLASGGLSGFSSRGKRIDGQSIMDIAAPGNIDVISALAGDAYGLGSYASFGGTSAAGPHVAGVAALLLQAFPQAGHLEIKEALQEGARTDSFTGVDYNNSWGYGKLDALGALNWLKEHLQPAGVQ